jgi:lipopolysaccharide export system ATP-binding protein
MHNVLEIDSVLKSFDGRRILSDIYLKCETGDIIGMLGRNGSGKSTLLKILFGAMATDHKYIKINGIAYNKPFKTIGLISYLPQHPFLLQHLSVEQTAIIYLDGLGIDSFFNDSLLGKLRQNKIAMLSGGEARYLEIKLLLSMPAKFVLLDEPFNGVAPIMIDQLKAMITQHSKTKGVILTDHDYNNVLDVANKSCIVYDGGIKPIENKSDLVRYNYLPVNSLD